MMVGELDTCKFTDDKEDDDEVDMSRFTKGFENFGYNIGKTNSLPTNARLSMLNWDTIQTALQISPEILASQLTILDFPIFANIETRELSTCAWTKKNKVVLAPNVVAFTRRFNQVSFWTVEEVLKGPNAKSRAEIITHLVKVSKALFELNNIHSLFAIISGLQSASIYRLKKTWLCISKKEKANFDKLAELFNECDNWSMLRKYMNEASLPCIPYLGIFLTDLVYTDLANNIDGNSGASKTDTILTTIAHYQKSDYNHLKGDDSVKEYLGNLRYIEELQKFHEDDQYKLSLKLEPPSNPNSTCSSGDSMRAAVAAEAASSVSTLTHRTNNNISKNNTSTLPGKLLSHRRCESAGNSIFNRGGESSNSTFESSNRVMTSLLDDTLMESTTSTLPMRSSTLNSYSDIVGTFPKELGDGQQGCLKRKTIQKGFKKPSISPWHRYWIQIWEKSLVYFPAKSFRGIFTASKTSFKEEPSKMQSLEDWKVYYEEKSDTFLLSKSSIGTTYKFRAESAEEARKWVSTIGIAISQFNRPFPANLMSFE